MGSNHHAPSASEVSAAIGGGLPEVWTPGEHDEPRDPHRSHAMVGEDPDVPQVCSRCALPDVSPQIEGVCREPGPSRIRERFTVAEVLDAIETAALTLFCRPGADETWEAEVFEAIAFGALDGLRAARKAA